MDTGGIWEIYLPINFSATLKLLKSLKIIIRETDIKERVNIHSLHFFLICTLFLKLTFQFTYQFNLGTYYGAVSLMYLNFPMSLNMPVWPEDDGCQHTTSQIIQNFLCLKISKFKLKKNTIWYWQGSRILYTIIIILLAKLQNFLKSFSDFIFLNHYSFYLWLFLVHFSQPNLQPF